ncbi:hypothetical protein BWGOE7_31560 [Bacillus mycoides]|nr:hypothetical protein BWGOE7_31560 [Bacillus mycoides]OFD94489.1 hypothetical protein BWGOE12_31080 [Bacillus mycoides]
MKNNVNVYIEVAAHAHQLKNLELPQNEKMSFFCYKLAQNFVLGVL